jgi:hypothetical protein
MGGGPVLRLSEKALPSPAARTGHPPDLLALERACHPPRQLCTVVIPDLTARPEL